MSGKGPIRRWARYRTTTFRSATATLFLTFGSPVATQPAIRADQAMRQARRMTEATPPCAASGTIADAIIVCGRDRENPFRIPDAIRAEPPPRKAGAATA